jgi:hypothetical protein
MTSRGHLCLLLVIGLLAVPASFRLELFCQEPTSATSPLDSSAWDVLRKGMDDGDAQHRKTVIAAIGTIGPEPEAVKLVVRGLQDKDTLVRQTAAATLGEMGAHDAVQHLKAALDDSPEVSFTAAKSLWQLGDTSSREIIQAVMAGERSDKPSMLHSAMKDAKHRLRPSQLALMGVKEASGTFLGPGSMGIDAIQEAMKEAKKIPPLRAAPQLPRFLAKILIRTPWSCSNGDSATATGQFEWLWPRLWASAATSRPSSSFRRFFLTIITPCATWPPRRW